LSGYLLDANVLIDWLDGRANARVLLERLGRQEQPVAVNAITIAETYSGLRAEDVPSVDRLMSFFDYWPIGLDVSKLAGSLRYEWARRGLPLAISDTILAAHAISRRATLVTGNVRDFPMPELQILTLDL
jgi:predicted nucleic acid-binding protein